MAIENQAKIAHPVIYGLIALFGLVELAISAHLVQHYNSDGYPSTSIQTKTQFLIFLSLWTLIFSLGYIGAFILATGNFLASIASHGIWIGITWLMWLIISASLTSALNGGLDCSPGFDTCGNLNGLLGISWLEFVLCSLAIVFVGFLGMRSARSGNGFGGALV